ncbi:hypothetical protein MRB53_040363 [Persea americana]|nr:hypothetical protein MRB53_040363 [Persea americana]
MSAKLPSVATPSNRGRNLRGRKVNPTYLPEDDDSDQAASGVPPTTGKRKADGVFVDSNHDAKRHNGRDDISKKGSIGEQTVDAMRHAMVSMGEYSASIVRDGTMYDQGLRDGQRYCAARLAERGRQHAAEIKRHEDEAKAKVLEKQALIETLSKQKEQQQTQIAGLKSRIAVLSHCREQVSDDMIKSEMLSLVSEVQMWASRARRDLVKTGEGGREPTSNITVSSSAPCDFTRLWTNLPATASIGDRLQAVATAAIEYILDLTSTFGCPDDSALLHASHLLGSIEGKSSTPPLA